MGNNENMIKPKLKIQFIDMGYEFDGYGYNSDNDMLETGFYKNISTQYDIELVEKSPDLVIGGWMTNNFYTSNEKFLFIAKEHYFPNGFFADYRIHNKYKSLKKNDFYMGDGVPIYKIENLFNGTHSNLLLGQKIKKTQFCNFIFSNKYTKKRNDFISAMLKRYGNDVHCWGRYKRNIEQLKIGNKTITAHHEPDEIMQHYKFSICFENSSVYHSFSEKVFNALCAGSIPIYWGGEAIYRFVKKGAFIDASDFKNFDELMDYIDKVNNEEKLYNSYIMKNPFVDSDFIRNQFRNKQLEFIDFVLNDKDYKRQWWKNRKFVGFILPILKRFYKIYWKFKSLKRRFFGGN